MHQNVGIACMALTLTATPHATTSSRRQPNEPSTTVLSCVVVFVGLRYSWRLIYDPVVDTFDDLSSVYESEYEYLERLNLLTENERAALEVSAI